jgi:hypothetical protein
MRRGLCHQAKEQVVIYSGYGLIEALSQNLLGGTEKKPSGWLVAWPRFKVGDTWDLGARGLSDCVEGSWM